MFVDNTTWDELFHLFVRYLYQVYVSDSYFLFFEIK